MKKNKFGDSMVELRSAVKTGIEGMRGISGQSGDRDVRLYERMKPRDLATLANVVGPSVVFDYIHDIELRRLRERK